MMSRKELLGLEEDGHHSDVDEFADLVLNDTLEDEPISYHVDLSSLARWRQRYDLLLYLLLLTYTFRSVSFFKIFRKGEVLVKSLSRALPEILSFLPIYFCFTFVSYHLCRFCVTNMFRGLH